MSAAPSRAEQYALYAEMFTFAAGSIVLFFVGIVFNWRVAKANLGDMLKPSSGPQTPVKRLGEGVLRQLNVWQGPLRRVRRTMTVLLAVGLMAIVFADSTIITVSGTTVRDDGVAAQWQRWAAYIFYMVVSTAAMAQYYGLSEVVTWIFALVPAAFGMAMGVFVTLTSSANSGSTDKVVNFSVWGGVLLAALIPIMLIFTRYSILRRLWRAFPIVFHVGFALSLWTILWTSSEVGGKNTVARRTASNWLYFTMVALWTLANMMFFYTWKMGPPKQVTHATDAVVKGRSGRTPAPGGGASTHHVVNVAPGSKHFSLGEPRLPPGTPQTPQYARAPYSAAASGTGGRY